MKQKTISEPVTRDDLKSAIEDLKTSTKADIKSAIEASEKRTRVDTRLVVQDAVIEITNLIIKFKDLILTTVDPLLKELEVRREDREISANQTYEIRQQLDDHEKRLSKLEHS